jgi:hypothetical protein
MPFGLFNYNNTTTNEPYKQNNFPTHDDPVNENDKVSNASSELLSQCNSPEHSFNGRARKDNINLELIMQEKIREIEEKLESKNQELLQIEINFSNRLEQIRNDIVIELQKQNEEKESNGIEKIRKEVLDDMILPDNKNYIENSLIWIKVWNFFAMLFVALKYIIMILVVPTLTFASTTFTEHYLNFAAGILSLCGIAFEKLSQFCSANAKKRNEKMNKMIAALGIEQTVIDITYEDPMLQTTQRMQQSSPQIQRTIYKQQQLQPQRATSRSVAQEMISRQYSD